ncbi:hypothetical protein C6W93_28950, partial [Mycobacterium kansasii]|nr:hypothetical protein [Mycobacterium kansasii]
MSGVYNTGTQGLTAPGNLSGYANTGTNLAGVLRDSATGTVFNAGLANIGALNVGFGNTGDYNLGSGNVGNLNL